MRVLACARECAFACAGACTCAFAYVHVNVYVYWFSEPLTIVYDFCKVAHVGITLKAVHNYTFVT